MNTEQVKGGWNIVKGQIKQKWGKFTDDDLTQINGKRDEILGKLQSYYGYTKEQAEEEFSAFENSLHSDYLHREDEFSRDDEMSRDRDYRENLRDDIHRDDNL